MELNTCIVMQVFSLKVFFFRVRGKESMPSPKMRLPVHDNNYDASECS